MESKKIVKDRAKRELVVEEEAEGEEEEVIGLGFGEFDKKKKAVVRRGSIAVGGISTLCCQAEKCTADLTNAKPYYRRHKVCEHHFKASDVIVAGIFQRFCQQCSRFHELSEFDEAKRSCRSRLAGHNERRRKNSSESHGEGSSHKVVDPPKENQFRQADQSGRVTIALTGNSKYF